MPTRPATPRIPPLPKDERDERQQELLDIVNPPGSPPGTGELNIFATLVRHPGLFRQWIGFGGKLLSGKLPPRERELLILRTAWRCQAVYEWGHHVEIGQGVGVTAEEVERVKAGPGAPGWDPFDAALLLAADELHDDSCITDATWATLAGRYDERQLVELTMVVGQYHLVSFALNSLGVQVEPGTPGFDA